LVGAGSFQEEKAVEVFSPASRGKERTWTTVGRGGGYFLALVHFGARKKGGRCEDYHQKKRKGALMNPEEKAVEKERGQRR